VGGRRKRNPPERPEAGWFTCADAARAFGLSDEGFRTQLRPLLAAADVLTEGRGRPTWIYMPALIQARVAQQVERAVADAGSDPMLVGSEGSKNLERYRLAKAIAQETDNEVRARRLLLRSDVQRIFDRVAGLLRRSVTTLQRKFGPDAYDVVSRAIADAERAIDDLFSSDA
jgi:predicted ArsR family transcriptional regulator